MMEFAAEWAFIAILTLVTAASPGPDFLIVVRNSMMHSRQTALFTVLGISAGICIHIIYSILGVAALIAGSAKLFGVVKYIGAGYLLYIGFKSLFSRGHGPVKNDRDNGAEISLTPGSAFRQGFFTNVLNPKVTLFFFALFTQVISLQTPMSIQLLYGLTVVVVGGGWWVFVVMIMTNTYIRSKFLRFSRWIDRITGGLLVALGVRLAISQI